MTDRVSLLSRLRTMRLDVGMLVAAVLMFNGVLLALADMGQAKAESLVSVIAGETCLGGAADADRPGDASSETKQRPADPRNCPTCAATCVFGGCTPPSMLSKAPDIRGRMHTASLEIGEDKSSILPRPLRHHTAAQAQAPPRCLGIDRPLTQGGAA